MRKISRAEEQHNSLNFRTADAESWGQKEHFRVVDPNTPVTEGGPKCKGCGEKMLEHGEGSVCRNRRCDKRDIVVASKKKEASAAEVLGLLTPAAIVAQPFIMDKINKRNDKKSKQEETTSTEHTCDVGDHKVHEDVRCVTPDCEHRGKSWETDGHQDWDHDYACSEHFTKGTTASKVFLSSLTADEASKTADALENVFKKHWDDPGIDSDTRSHVLGLHKKLADYHRTRPGPDHQEAAEDHSSALVNGSHIPASSPGRAIIQSIPNAVSSTRKALMPTDPASGAFSAPRAFEGTERTASWSQRYAKEEKKTFTPPQGVQAAARKALKWIEEGHAGSGFTGVGRGRAHQLANGESVSLSTIKRMHSFFSRHRVDKQGKDWNKPSPGKVAWYAWGGDAGASWAAGIAKSHGGDSKESSVDDNYANDDSDWRSRYSDLDSDW
jgi:hypothetical protein